jgi:type III restriction enzyme
MSERFFKDPILNSPYERPSRHWELDADGIPTQREREGRRESRLITPIPQPRKRGGKGEQRALAFGAQDLGEDAQQYEVSQQINSIRSLVDEWRQAPESQWKVTPKQPGC